MSQFQNSTDEGNPVHKNFIFQLYCLVLMSNFIFFLLVGLFYLFTFGISCMMFLFSS